MKEHNYGVDAYRFLLMTWIVLFHYTVRYNELGLDKGVNFMFTFDNGGSVGVSLFFMVSGFFMTKSLLTENYGLNCYGKYIANRYLRLWIPYAIACLFIYIWLIILPVKDRNVDGITLLANLSCLIHTGFDRVDSAHWFLADLIFIQILLGLTLLIKREIYKQHFLQVIYAVVMVLQVFTPPILAGFSKELYEVTLGMQLWITIKEINYKNVILSMLGLAVAIGLSFEFFIFTCIFVILVADIGVKKKNTPPQVHAKYAFISRQC